MLRPFYVCFFTALAFQLAFFPPYLRGLGLSGRELSFILVIPPVLYLGVPLFWGWLADRWHRPDRVLRIVCFGTLLGAVPLVFVNTMPALALVYLAQQLFAVGIIPITDSLALEQARLSGQFGRIRVWGSASFAITCTVAGTLLAAAGPESDMLVPRLMVGALALTALAALGVRSQGVGHPRPHMREVKLLLADPRFRFLLLVAPLHWGSTAPFNNFLAILIRDRGLSPAVVGRAFTVSVLGELVVLYFFSRLRSRFRLTTLFGISFAVTTVRWLLLANAHSAIAIVALQALHACTFGIFWCTAMAWLGECVPPPLRATGQALYTTLAYGVGNIVGVLGTGFIYDAAGSAAPAFVVGGLVDLVALLLLLTRGRRLAL